MKKRKLSAAVKLQLARAELRGIKRAVEGGRVTYGSMAADFVKSEGPAKFIQCWTVQRGYTGITQALDEDGQVWERVIIIQNVAGRKTPTDSWWEPIPTTRKAAGAAAREAADVLGAS